MCAGLVKGHTADVAAPCLKRLDVCVPRQIGLKSRCSVHPTAGHEWSLADHADSFGPSTSTLRRIVFNYVNWNSVWPGQSFLQSLEV